MERFFLCHYHEVGLKGSNRTFFENRLRSNITRALTGIPIGGVRRISGRILVELKPESSFEPIAQRLGNIFGLASFSPSWLSEQDVEPLTQNLLRLLDDQCFESFRIQARRANKRYPLNSQELNEKLGAAVVKSYRKKVDLETPELTCYVDIVEKFAFLYFEKFRGPGGLPVSTSGRVLALLSGGIDSPVAAYKIMKRGCRVVFVHFHSYPHTSLESQDKVRQLVRVLNRYQFYSRLHLVPFADCQQQVVAFTPAETRVILYRRLMLRIAERIALREGAQALVTGDSLGQVASQTLENLAVIGSAAALPLLRPCVGEDKEEIIQLARKIGTFEISIQPDVDCCSLFVPRHPETRARGAGIERVEQQLDLEAMIERAVSSSRIEKLGLFAEEPEQVSPISQPGSAGL
ncbi:MAG: tRNA 4-thiouridine(8) synthase ThiI [Acidobacteria bacterium]|nr:tRNA 4-thiouridine(8) synthase ThiI [Acidobacteriota bacterium]